MHFHGAYFSNYDIWSRDPKHSLPSAQLIWQIIGQHLLNSDIGNSFQGIHITSGIFQLWRSEGIITQIHLVVLHFSVQFYLSMHLIFICISLR